MQPPIYPPFLHSITNRNLKLILNLLQYEEGYYRMDYDDLQAKIAPRTKMLLFCSPHNPAGRVWHKEELEKLLEITQKQGIVVVSDEVHSDIVWTPHTPLYAALLEDLARRYPRCMRFVKPQGAYLAWIEFTNLNDKQLFEGLIKQGLGVSMGRNFGKGGRGFVRLNCTLPRSIM